MNQVGTVGDLIELAAKAEYKAGDLYGRIGEMFSHHPDVASFWSKYSSEEVGHARWMENLLKRTDDEKLAEVADPEVWSLVNRIVAQDTSSLLSNIHSLQDAWDLANEMEHGETNIIFEFLISNFSSDQHTLTFLRTQLRDHVGHLITNLPPQFADAEVRRSVFRKDLD